MTSYLNIEAFYDEDPRRRRSGEADYGVWWTNGKPWPYWRVSYVQTTGEVYAEEGQGGRVVTLGVVPPDQDDIYYRTLNKVLDGWSEELVRPLSWVRERLQAAATRVDSL